MGPVRIHNLLALLWKNNLIQSYLDTRENKSQMKLHLSGGTCPNEDIHCCLNWRSII